MKAIGREDLLDDPRMIDGTTRFQNREAVDAAITEWTSKRTKEEVMRVIAGAGVPCGAVKTTLELLHDPDLHARGMMQTIDHPMRGTGHRAGLAAADVGHQGRAEMLRRFSARIARRSMASGSAARPTRSGTCGKARSSEDRAIPATQEL